jgi:hypothetical protein
MTAPLWVLVTIGVWAAFVAMILLFMSGATRWDDDEDGDLQ